MCGDRDWERELGLMVVNRGFGLAQEKDDEWEHKLKTDEEVSTTVPSVGLSSKRLGRSSGKSPATTTTCSDDGTDVDASEMLSITEAYIAGLCFTRVKCCKLCRHSTHGMAGCSLTSIGLGACRDLFFFWRGQEAVRRVEDGVSTF